MPVELIIFDLDGTLVDSSQDLADAFNYALEPYGSELFTVGEIKQLTGGGLHQLIEKMPVRGKIAFDRETVARRFFAYHSEHLADHTRPYKGVPETLEQLRAYKKVVVSNKITEFCKKILEQLGLLHYFDLIVGSDMVHESKPSPEPILFVLKQFNVPADRAVIVGDSMNEVRAGKAAGVRIIGATYGFGGKGLWKNTDYTIRSFSQLPIALRMMDERSFLTGRWNPRSAQIDTMPVGQIIDLMNDEDALVAQAVRSVRDAVAKAVLHAVECINAGGSLIYIGAGTSGRLAVLDAADLPRAFSVPPGTVRAIMAGGVEALTASVEGVSEDESAGRAAVADIRPVDMCMGITAGGRTPFVLAALRAAKERGARCWLLTFNDVDYPFLDGVIKVLTGAELITGSTRLKAGTATKMVLNMLSTAVMIRLGYVHDGYTVDVAPTDERLSDRARAIVASITGCPEDEGGRLLSAAGGSIKTALVMHVKGLTRDESAARLMAAGGNLRKALE